MFSLCGCVLCGYYHDWYCFSMILLGIVANGLSWLVIGSLALVFLHPKPAGGSPPGDGILKYGKGLVMLRGDEGAVNSVTRGQFVLKFEKVHNSHRINTNVPTDPESVKEPQQQPNPDPHTDPQYNSIGISSTLLLLQFLLQLLLIPQGTLFGQIMFLSTLVMSWAYNSFLSSIDGTSIQGKLLVEEILGKPIMKRFSFGTWTSMTVFTLLAAQFPKPLEQRKTANLLDYLIPNDTVVWMRWKEWVLENIAHAISNGSPRPFGGPVPSYQDLGEEENGLLSNFVDDAKTAYEGFIQNHDNLV
jgi:hypothetical protein